MAQIPMGNFGKAVAQPGPMVNVPRGNPLGEATANLIHTSGAIVDDMRREEAEIRDKADKAQTVGAMAETQARLKASRDELSQQVLTGQVDKTKAADAWQEQSAKIIEESSKGLPPSHSNMATAQLRAHAFELSDGIHRTVQQKDIEDTKSGLLAYLDGAERDVLTDRAGAVQRAADAIDQLGPWAGYGSDDRQRLTQTFKEKAAFTVGSAMVRTARDDMKSLDQVMERIKSPEFGDLDPGKLGQLEQQVLGRKQYLLHQEQLRVARAEAAAARRDREAEQAFKATQSLIDGGAVPDSNFLATVQHKISGTAYAPVLTQLLQQANENASFALLPPQQQQASLLALRSQANAHGSNPQAEARISNLERIASKSAEQLRDDPLVYGMNRRLIGSVQPIQFGGDVSALVGLLPQRVQQAQTVSARVGRPVSPLLASEASQLSQALNILPIAQREQALQSIARSVPDPGMVQALAQQIEPKDRTLALAMFASGKRAPGGESPSLLILRAKDALDAGRVKDNDEAAKLAHQDIAQRLSAVPWATPQARDAAIDATQRIWLGLKDQKRDSVRTAVDIATGGLTEWADSKVPLPYGMGEREFTRAMRGMSPERLAMLAGGETFTVNGHSVSARDLAATLPQTKLIPIGDGIYALQSGNAIVQARGGVFRLKLEP